MLSSINNIFCAGDRAEAGLSWHGRRRLRGDGDAGTREGTTTVGQQRHTGTDDGQSARRRGYNISAVNYTLICGNCARQQHFFDRNDFTKNNIGKEISAALNTRSAPDCYIFDMYNKQSISARLAMPAAPAPPPSHRPTGRRLGLAAMLALAPSVADWPRVSWPLLAAAVLLAALAALAGAYRWHIATLTRRHLALEQLVVARSAELAASQAQLAALETADALTGVGNRRAFDLALAAEWRRSARSGQALALLLCDIDHFALYNAHYRQRAGDACLRAVAQLLGAHGRRSTDLVARYDGDRFALLAAATDASDAFGMAETLHKELARHALPHAQSPFGAVTVSIGVAARQAH